MRRKLVVLTLGPAVLVSGLASYGLANDKSHKEAWSDPYAEEPVLVQTVTADGMVPFYPDMAPHPIAVRGAGPMVAELGHMQGARLLEQQENVPGIAPASASAVGGAAAVQSQRQGERMTDGKILQVAHVANAGEIDQARLAASRAQDPAVRNYAQMMIRMHAAAERQDADVARRHSLKMVSNRASENLMKDGRSTMDMLQSKSGAEFDHAYIDAQIKNHETVLNLIDTRLEPSAHDKDVRNLVSGMRPVVQSHLDQARDIQSKLKE